MDTFFDYLKKSLIATIFVIFAFVGTYIPQDWNQVEKAYANPGEANLPMQIVQNISLLAGNVSAAATAAYSAITSFATNSLFLKETVLDGLFWALAKSIISSMVSSLVDWINSGFKGRPAFVEDVSDFLLNAADAGFGRYLEEIGGIGSFICSPFRLDVQISLELQYQRSRVGQTAPTCTLTGVIDNIEGFLDGTQGSFTENGGWNDWFDITSQPQTYTPYGAILSAQEGLDIRILNEKGESLTEINMGSGFLSGKICQAVTGSKYEDCSISKPGKIIEEALSFNLDSGRQTLIAADEVDEVFAALVSQLANMAITGVNGLLGLSGGTKYTYTKPDGSAYQGGSYLNELAIEASELIDTSGALQSMQEVLATQKRYKKLAEDYLPRLQKFKNTAGRLTSDIADANAEIIKANRIIANTTTDIDRLERMIAEFNNPNTSVARKSTIANTFSTMSFYMQPEITASQSTWQELLNRPIYQAVPINRTATIALMEAVRTTQDSFQKLAGMYEHDLTLYSQDPANTPTKKAQASVAASDAREIIENTESYISQLDSLLARFTDSEVNIIEERSIVDDFNNLNLSLYTQSEVKNKQETWDAILLP